MWQLPRPLSRPERAYDVEDVHTKGRRRALGARGMVFLTWDEAVAVAESINSRYLAMIYLAVDRGLRWSVSGRAQRQR